jgi:hypothetical protein
MSVSLGRTRDTFAVAFVALVASLTFGTASAWALPDFDGDGSVAPADCAPLDPAVHPGAVDKPDLSFEDTNCDGIDGDKAKAIFVALGGNDGNPGSVTSPKRTIAAAITAAAGTKDVYVAAGDAYTETINLVSNVGIYGGYEPITGARAVSPPTIVRAAPAALAVGDQNVTLQLLTLEGTSDGANAYGIRAIPNGATPSRIFLDTVTARGLAASGGSNGISGITGTTGLSGNSSPGSCTPGSARTGGAGGNGGSGGGGGLNAAGANGSTGQTLSGGGGLGGGLLGTISGIGNNGGQGADGGTGANNPVQAPSDLATWPTNFATGGNSGGAGGGGGGGRGGVGDNNFGVGICGGGGGGGGTGGGGGGAGSAGQNGGGSFGAFLFNSSLVATDSKLIGGNGGKGGNGGTGAFGGGGGGRGFGAGGDCLTVFVTVCGSSGANGGLGGAGGRGGGGGAGSGGPSASVYQAGAGSGYAPKSGVTETTGTAGAGGTQGNTGTVAPSGQTAQRMRSGTAPVNSTADFDGDGINDVSDSCPADAAPGTANGCAARPAKLADSDGDGIPDNADTCPAQPRGATDATEDGCPDAPPSTGGGGGGGDTGGGGGGTSGGGGGGTTGGGGGGGVAGAGAERILIAMPFAFSKSTKKFTVFTVLQIKAIPIGSTLKVTCKAPKGKKCPGGKSFTKKNAFGTVKLKQWTKKKLPAGTKLTAMVTKPGNFIGAVKTMTVKKKARPSFSDKCTAPGSTKAVGC